MHTAFWSYILKSIEYFINNQESHIRSTFPLTCNHQHSYSMQSCMLITFPKVSVYPGHHDSVSGLI